MAVELNTGLNPITPTTPASGVSATKSADSAPAEPQFKTRKKWRNWGVGTQVRGAPYVLVQERVEKPEPKERVKEVEKPKEVEKIVVKPPKVSKNFLRSVRASLYDLKTLSLMATSSRLSEGNRETIENRADAIIHGIKKLDDSLVAYDSRGKPVTGDRPDLSDSYIKDEDVQLENRSTSNRTITRINKVMKKVDKHLERFRPPPPPVMENGEVAETSGDGTDTDKTANTTDDAKKVKGGRGKRITGNIGKIGLKQSGVGNPVGAAKDRISVSA